LLKVTGKQNALESPGVRQVYIKPKKDSLMIPPVSMAYRYAYVLATGDSAREAKQNAERGAAHITFHLRPVDAFSFFQLCDRERRFLEAAEKNREHMDKIAAHFNHFILYDTE
jgi:hypothetical protein